jgi:hypothetical protein
VQDSDSEVKHAANGRERWREGVGVGDVGPGWGRVLAQVDHDVWLGGSGCMSDSVASLATRRKRSEANQWFTHNDLQIGVRSKSL